MVWSSIPWYLGWQALLASPSVYWTLHTLYYVLDISMSQGILLSHWLCLPMQYLICKFFIWLLWFISLHISLQICHRFKISKISAVYFHSDFYFYHPLMFLHPCTQPHIHLHLLLGCALRKNSNALQNINIGSEGAFLASYASYGKQNFYEIYMFLKTSNKT